MYVVILRREVSTIDMHIQSYVLLRFLYTLRYNSSFTTPPLPQPPLLEVARIQHHDVQAFHDLGACGGTIFIASSCRTRLGTRVSIGLERASGYTADALPS